MCDSDRELVDRYVCNNEEDAFRILMERYQLPVFQIAASILGLQKTADVEDVVQEVFVRVHRSLASYRAESKFSTWLYRVAYNQAITKKSTLSGKFFVSGSDHLADIAQENADPSADLEKLLVRQELDAAIDRLPVEYQVVVRLYYWHQISISEISSRTNIRENTTKSYLHRARKLLAVYLKKVDER
ncbi:MAG: RNA polymerase sigma factor [Aureliella sp.]